MLIDCRIIALGALLSLLSSCASLSTAEPKANAVRIEGVVSFGREITFSDFSITGSGISISSKGCINGIFQDHSKMELDEDYIEGDRVVSEGYLLNYISYASSDPVMATVSRLQNLCGNENFLMVSSITKK